MRLWRWIKAFYHRPPKPILKRHGKEWGER